MFPIAMNAVPVSYANSDILKVTASFNFDRYVCGKTNSYSVYSGIDNNKEASKAPPNLNQSNAPQPPTSSPTRVPVRGSTAGNYGGVVFRDIDTPVTQAIVRDEFFRKL